MTSSPPVTSPVPAKVEELRLGEIAEHLPGLRIAGISTGRGQASWAVARQRPDARVACWYLDQYRANLARAESVPLSNLSFLCQSDWPEGEIDMALLPISKSGESELVRDILQSAYHHLAIGGYLVASVDHPQDRFLHDLLKSYEKSVKVRPFDDAVVYFIQKTKSLKKLKDFTCQLSFRDCDMTIQLVTRPGVFSHRQFDQGARQILDAVDVFPEARLVDIGCGSGAVGLALAARDASAEVHAFDSNARAVACVQEAVRLNGLSNLRVAIDSDGEYGEAGKFDMALANPPYYADFRIARHFIETARRLLRAGGRLVLVTKQPRWYQEQLPEYLTDVEVFESGRYWIASGVKAESA